MALIGSLSDALLPISVGILAILIWSVISFYLRLKDFPPGPLPLPYFGNTLSVLFSGKRADHMLEEMSKVYGGMFTDWSGPTPRIIIFEPKWALQVLKSKSFSGRPRLTPTSNNPTLGTDIVFDDHHRAQEVHRRLTFQAIRKYIANPFISDHAMMAVDQVVEKYMLSDKKDNINMDESIHTITMLLLSMAAFGEKFRLEDKVFQELKGSFDSISLGLRITFILASVPLLRPFLIPKLIRIVRGNQIFGGHIREKVAYHEKTFEEHASNRDFTDALLWTKKQAELEGDTEALKYIDRQSIMRDVGNVFFAGTETTRASLNWWFLRLAVSQECQHKIRKEVADVIGDDIPNLDHRSNCHYVQAFTSEVLRLHPAAKLALPHKALEDKEIGGYTIKKGTTVLISLLGPMTDPEIWGEDAQEFKPERFLDESGHYVPRPNPYFLTFSTGPRSCIGEKLAFANIFLVTTRIMQLTKGYTFQATLKGDPKSLFEYDLEKTFCQPNNLTLKLVPTNESH